jgi:hypothetical protein
MSIQKSFAVSFQACVLAAGAFGQESPPTIVKKEGALASLTEQLRQHHVELTEAGLLKALAAEWTSSTDHE